MLFNSLDYIVFLALIFTLFWGLSPGTNPFLRRLARSPDPTGRVAMRTARTALLLVASYLFYMSWNSAFVLLIIASTLIDYWVALALGASQRAWIRKGLVGISLAANLGLLGAFKYADFLQSALVDVLGWINASRVAAGYEASTALAYEPEYLRLIVPVGISFYTFQTLSYTLDVYRRRIEPSRNILEFATYVAFFPQLVAGPIVRASEFLPQFLSRPRLSTEQARSGLYLIVRGLIKKVAIADFLGSRIIDRVWDDPSAYSTSEVWLAVYAYSWQLYGDFSGYTDIARGSARLLGFELPQNFNRPYNSTGPIEFWRGWHITLSRWVQDYVYISLGGSRISGFRTYVNLFVTFMVIGLWHGAGWTFVIFGLWHAIGVCVNRLVRQITKSPEPITGWSRPIFVFFNFSFFIIHWPIFRSTSVEQMMAMYRQMFAADYALPRVEPSVYAVVAAMSFLHFCPRSWIRRSERFLSNLPAPVLGVLIAFVGALLMHLASTGPAPFIYFQF